MRDSQKTPRVPETFRIFTVGLLIFLAFILTNCTKPAPSHSAVPAPVTPEPATPQATSFTATPYPTSSTSVPLAALVNGEPVTLEEFQAELSRYQASVGTELATEDQQRVLGDLIDQLLLEQAARGAGYASDEQGLQQCYDRLVAQLGSEQVLKDWLASNGYSEASFRHALARSIAAAWMRDQIAAGVPQAVEQVHARQILLYNSAEADSVLAQLRSGADFGELAAQYDPAAGGDLGWFPAGYLLDAKLDEAISSLQPGEFSAVIQTVAGYHILQVLERDPQRPLEPAARQALQLRAVQDWLAERRSQSKIQILLP